MTNILTFKEALRKMYSRDSMYINPILRFTATLFTMLIINFYTGEAGILSNPVVAIIISAVCALLPMSVIVVITSIFTILNIYYVSPEMAIVSMIIYIIMYIFYFRFSSKYGYVMLLTQIMMFIKFSYIVPIFVGIAFSPAAAVSMIFGIVAFYMLKGVNGDAAKLSGSSSTSGVDGASTLLKYIIQNKEMTTLIIAFVIATLIVYGIRKMSVDYAGTIAIIIGGVMELSIIVVAAYIMELEAFMPIWLTGVLVILAIIIMYFGQYLILAVDYAGTEFTQFEDDDYYYYVKAVPKVKVTASNVKISHINSRTK